MREIKMLGEVKIAIFVVFVAILIWLTFLFGMLGFSLFGQLTHDTLTFEVVDKDTYLITIQNRIVTGFRVFSVDERFSISEPLYNEIIIGKKHTVYVTGVAEWPGDRNIVKILE